MPVEAARPDENEELGSDLQGIVGPSNWCNGEDGVSRDCVEASALSVQERESAAPYCTRCELLSQD